MCPECGSKEIKQGKQTSYARMYPIDMLILRNGSEIIADICSNCGYIISMRVKDPEKI